MMKQEGMPRQNRYLYRDRLRMAGKYKRGPDSHGELVSPGIPDGKVSASNTPTHGTIKMSRPGGRP